jgi:hypothetical protein
MDNLQNRLIHIIFKFLEQEHLSFKTFEGELEIGSQHHSYMENLTHIVRPIENGEFEIYPTTQWMHCCAAFVAQVLDIQAHKVDVKVNKVFFIRCRLIIKRKLDYCFEHSMFKKSYLFFNIKRFDELGARMEEK